MAVTKSIEITPCRFVQLVNIKFHMNVPGIELFHQNLMDVRNSKGDVIVQTLFAQ